LMAKQGILGRSRLALPVFIQKIDFKQHGRKTNKKYQN
jgi:hypothetical protein